MMRSILFMCFAAVLVAASTATGEIDWAEEPESGLWQFENSTNEKICMKIDGKLSLMVFYYNTEKNMTESVRVNIPKTARVVNESTTCGRVIAQPMMHSQMTLGFLNHWTLTLNFTNDYVTGGCANWMQFCLAGLTLDGSFKGLEDHFPHAMQDTFHMEGGDTRFWRGNYSTLNDTTLMCNKQLTVRVNDSMDADPAMLASLGESAHDLFWFMTEDVNMVAFSGNQKLPPSQQCMRDLEHDDSLVVILGSVQIGVVFLILFLYLIYLMRRDEVKVPTYLIEPSMRYSAVQPMGEQNFQRRMTTLSANPDYTPEDGSKAEKRKVTIQDDEKY